MNKLQRNRAIMIAFGLALLLLVGAALTGLWDDSPGPDASAAVSAVPAQAEREESAVPSASLQPGTSINAARTDTQESPDSRQAAQALRTGGEDERRAQEGPARTTAADESTVSPQTGRALSDIIGLLNADRFDEATAQLDELMTAENMAKMSAFEQSRLYQLSFNLNMQAKNFEAASADIQAALESGGLNEREFNQMSYQRAQLFVQMEDYAKAADSLELWVADQRAEPNPAAYYLLAASYYYQDKFDDARDHMETMMAMPGEKQEAWYQMMASLYMQNSDYAKAKPVVEKLVELFDDPRYRDQLAGINAELAKPR